MIMNDCEGMDGVSGLNGAPECTSTVCEDSNCAVVDNWFLFDQTCTILANRESKETCSKFYVIAYSFVFESLLYNVFRITKTRISIIKTSNFRLEY